MTICNLRKIAKTVSKGLSQCLHALPSTHAVMLLTAKYDKCSTVTGLTRQLYSDLLTYQLSQFSNISKTPCQCTWGNDPCVSSMAAT